MMLRNQRRPRAGRLAAVTTAVVAASVFTMAPTAEAKRPTTESQLVADSADHALRALDRWEASRRPAHYVRYLRARERTAELLADEVGVAAEALADEWANADDRHQIALLSALTQLGVKYRTNARKPDQAFDCSGLTSWAWAEAGVELPRSSRYQIRAADEVETDDEARAGFLVYYPGHISMYVGQGFMIHAPATGSNVQIGPVSKRTSAIGDPVTDDVLADLEPSSPPAALF